MLLSEKLLYAFAILMQICNILVQCEFLKKIEIFTFLFETYVSFMGVVLAPTKKFRHLRTTRKDTIPLNHRPGYRPDAAYPV